MGNCFERAKEWNKFHGGYKENKRKQIVASDTMDFHEQRNLLKEENAELGDMKMDADKSGWLLNGGSDVSLYIVTWNMNGKDASHDLPKLLEGKQERFDFYVMGLQEAPHGDIAAIIQKALGRDYRKVSVATIKSLQLYIFGRKYWDPLIRDVRVGKIRSGGLGGVVGRQKGAVAISFKFIHASFIFISCHLAPHEGNVEERNSQYQHISQTMFSDSSRRLKINPLGFPRKENKIITPTSLETSDMVVWLGDLNYRVEASRKSAGFLINQNLQQLQRKDQLSQEAKKGEIFRGFCEGPLSFRPTYKYDIGTDDYDTSSKVYNKKIKFISQLHNALFKYHDFYVFNSMQRRVPSWTDRILYKINSPSIMKAHVEEYNCMESIKESDHKPVKAHLHVNFKQPLINNLQITTPY